MLFLIDFSQIFFLFNKKGEKVKLLPLLSYYKNAQEMVEKAIKRARHMALIPYIVDTKNITDTAYARSFL
jgi:small subunit ribosomal protein S18